MTDESVKAPAFVYEYDGAEGTFSTRGSLGIEEVIQVAVELKEKALRHAVVAELRKLGYVVIPPGEEP